MTTREHDAANAAAGDRKAAAGNRKVAAPTPRVVVSECLGFAAVRYNGAILSDRFVAALAEHVDFVPLCPEVGIGLGVPRDPIRLVAGPDGPRLLQPSSGRDLTASMAQYAEQTFAELPEPDGFLLKSRSPSCGIKDVKVYRDGEAGPPVGRSPGAFAAAVQRRYPHLVIEGEGRLSNFGIRHHFLTRLWAAARFRAARDEAGMRGGMAALVRYHSEHKLLLMAYAPEGQKRLGRIIANAPRRPVAEVAARYARELGYALHRPASRGRTVNALQHAFGYVSKALEPAERTFVLEQLERYRHGRLPLSAVMTLVRALVVRFDEPYLAVQRLFAPYPEELFELTDSGSGRA